MWLAREYSPYAYAELGSRSLEDIREELGDCRRCELCETRNKLVFGSGNPQASVMIIGEAPGANEDKQGEPFVGKAGQRLQELLALAGLNRDDIYIANVLKCRPPQNRNPHVFEIEMCAPYLREQVLSINPRILVTLGNFATRFVLKTDEGISTLRGKEIALGSFTVFPLYHPAATIYDPSKLPVLEDDFRRLGQVIRGLAMEDAGGLDGLALSGE